MKGMVINMKVLRVNTRTKAVGFEAMKDEWKLFGNRGLVAKILTDEVNPKCDPLGRENKLIFATGLFAGTPIPTANRLSVGTKSPLTGGIKEASSGGTIAMQMAGMDIKAIIVEDQPEDGKWQYLFINPEGEAALLPADEYLGLGNYAFVEKMHALYGADTAVAVVGVAGERLHTASTIQVTDNATGHPCRSAGRGGVGAVLGSKKIKGLIISKPLSKVRPVPADKELFNNGKKRLIGMIQSHPYTGAGLAMLGTPAFVDVTSELGILPVKNFNGEKLEPEKLSGLESRAFIAKINNNKGKVGVACQAGCTIRCSNIVNDKDGNMITSGLEYETIALSGSNCDIYDYDFIAETDRFCDDFGVDTIEVGNAVAIAMEEGKIAWGDIEAVRNIYKEMQIDQGLGKLVSDGAVAVGKFLNAKRIPAVKNQALAAYDPRGSQGMGIVFETSAQGADHTTLNTLGIDGYDHRATKGIAKLLMKNRISATVGDNMLCMFASIAISADKDGYKAFAEALSGLYGESIDEDKVKNIGIETLNMEFAFNQKAGFTPEDDRLPSFFSTETASSTGMKYEVSHEESQASII